MVLEISLNLYLDIGYKRDRFSEILQEKSFKFVSNKENSTFIFYLSLMLLSAEANLVIEKQSYKKDMLMACNTSHVKIIVALSTEIVILYV